MKKHLLILALHLASSGSDAYFTHRNESRRYHWEENPVARPFVEHGTPLLVGGFAVELGMELWGARELRRYHHEKLAGMVDATGVGGHTFGAVYSSQHYFPKGKGEHHK